jgi:beta-glucosidase
MHQGFRDDTHPGTTTQFPSGLSVAATWDVAAVESWGAAISEEFVLKGANVAVRGARGLRTAGLCWGVMDACVQLGPGMCITRVPVCGRAFEYVSGEDPMLGYHMSHAAVLGLQSTGVIANAKHYMANNQVCLLLCVCEGCLRDVCRKIIACWSRPTWTSARGWKSITQHLMEQLTREYSP